MSEELKPCPFCGGSATLSDEKPFTVECEGCGVRTAMGQETPDYAIESWNTRPAPVQVPVRLDLLTVLAEGLADVKLPGNRNTFVRELASIIEKHAAPAPATVATEAVAQGVRAVRFVCVNPLTLTDGASLPMFRDSWRFAFWERDGQLCFGMRDDGPLVAYDAIHRRQYQPECMACSENWICQGGPGCKEAKTVAQGSGVDVEKVMALVEEYGEQCEAAGYLDRSGSQDASKKLHDTAYQTAVKIRALLSASPAGVGGCTCEACVPRNQFGGPTMMSLCPECGDKRCPKAKHHSNACAAAPAIAKQESQDGR